MTCIVGLQSGKSVLIGGDSAGTSGNLSQRILGDKKVFNKGKFVFGVCGLPKVIDAIRYTFDIPEQDKSEEDRAYISATFLPAFKECLKEAGCFAGEHDREESGHEESESNQDNLEEVFVGAVLFGYKGKLYRIESNFQIITNAYEFDAVGSGQDIAIGALHSSKKNSNAKKRILSALEASAINNAGVRPPFTIVQTRLL